VIEFEKNLAEIIGIPSTQRPFVCSGHPSSCNVWVVGFNAATTGGDWWRFWSADRGFDLASWRKDYDAERASRQKKASATRLRIDRIRASVPNLLETNIFSAPSTKMSNMPGNSTDAFDLLLATFSPRTIIAHGVPAANHLSAWKDGHLIVCPHLSRVGYNALHAIVENVQNILRPPN
jgi:hypothetical protein